MNMNELLYFFRPAKEKTPNTIELRYSNIIAGIEASTKDIYYWYTATGKIFKYRKYIIETDKIIYKNGIIEFNRTYNLPPIKILLRLDRLLWLENYKPIKITEDDRCTIFNIKWKPIFTS